MVALVFPKCLLSLGGRGGSLPTPARARTTIPAGGASRPGTEGQRGGERARGGKRMGGEDKRGSRGGAIWGERRADPCLWHSTHGPHAWGRKSIAEQQAKRGGARGSLWCRSEPTSWIDCKGGGRRQLGMDRKKKRCGGSAKNCRWNGKPKKSWRRGFRFGEFLPETVLDGKGSSTIRTTFDECQ